MTRTVETTRRSKVHKRTEHSDGSSEEYRKSSYSHEVKTEASGSHHGSRALPSSSRSSIGEHYTPHRLAIEAAPLQDPGNRYDAAALRAPSAVSYGGGPTRTLRPTPSAVSYGGGRRVASTIAPCDSASNVTPRGHGPGHGHGGSRVSNLGGGGTPVRVGEPQENPNMSFQYCARDGHWTTRTLAQIAGGPGQWYQIPGNPPYFVAD